MTAGGEQPALGGLPLLVLAEHLGVVARGRSSHRASFGLQLAGPPSRGRGPRRSAPTSRRRESPSRSMELGFGLQLHRRRRRPAGRAPPEGVSIGRFSMAGTLSRVCRGAPDRRRRRPCRPRKMSPTSSPATRVAAARRTSPGLRPYFSAFGQVDLHLRAAARRSRCRRAWSSTPSMPARILLISSALARSTVRSSP